MRSKLLYVVLDYTVATKQIQFGCVYRWESVWDTGGLKSSLKLMAHPVKIRNYYYYHYYYTIHVGIAESVGNVGCILYYRRFNG